ncbi:hypothetical protein P0Y35_08140 [Kiritimatiellaeota bacterium B1221]|nr:hypothetical protein [Kiritimatiellaeota bacterium B1221]
MRRILTGLFMLSGWAFAQAPKLETHHYTLDQVPALFEKKEGSDNPKFLEAHFTQYMGITFPEGSWMKFQKAGNVLSMQNTNEQHAWLKLGLAQQNLIQSHIHFTFRIIAFDKIMIDKFDRQYPAGIPDPLIHKLYLDGKGETVAIQNINMENWTTKTFEVESEGASEPNQKEAQRKKNPYSKSTFGVTATMSESKRSINLKLEALFPPSRGVPEDNPTQAELRIPHFSSLNMVSRFTIGNGKTIVAGQSSSIDNQSQFFFLISADIRDREGRAIHCPMEKEEGQ